MSLFETGIRPALDEWLLQESQKTRDYGEYWPASSAGYCMRKVIFERLGMPHLITEDAARKQRVFTAGHLFHEWAQRITKKAGLTLAQEAELADDLIKVKGHIDDLVSINDRLILYDYKTQNSRAFGYKRDEMSHYHKMQLGTYMYMLRNSDYPELTEGRILKIEKDTMRMLEEQLLWTAQLEKEIVGYWSTLNGYWKRQVIPRCTCADFEGGFLARERYNPYFFDGEPCSIKLYEQWKASKATNPQALVDRPQ